MVYFYNNTNIAFPESFNQLELEIVRIFLLKKINPASTKSRTYMRLMYMRSEDVSTFMRAQKPVNRKNLVQQSLFVKAWKFLQDQRGDGFWEHYFAGRLDIEKSGLADFKTRHLKSSLKLTSELYAACLGVASFGEDLFSLLSNPGFKNYVMQCSKNKFALEFDEWTRDMEEFVAKTEAIFIEIRKVPAIKLGMTEAEFDTGVQLLRHLSEA